MRRHARGSTKLGVDVFSSVGLATYCLFAALIVAILFLCFRGSLVVSALGEPTEFGLAQIGAFFSESSNLKAIGTSLGLATRAFIALPIAITISWLLVRVKIPFALFFEFTFLFVFLAPVVPLLTGWMLLADPSVGLLNQIWPGARLVNLYSWGGLFLSQITLQTIPILVVLSSQIMRSIDYRLEQAALSHGHSGWSVFKKIIIPLVLPASAVLVIASFMKSLESLEVELLLGVRSGIDVVSTQIYNFALEEPPRYGQAMTASSLLLLVMLLLAAFHFYWSNRRNSFEFSNIDAPRDEVVYSKRLKWVGALLVSLFVLITAALPIFALISGSFMKIFGMFDLAQPWTIANWSTLFENPRFYKALSTTILLGGVCGVMALISVAAMASYLQMRAAQTRSMAALLIWLPWAVPGVVLSFIFFDLFTQTPIINALYGTVIPMVIALVLKELPILYHLYAQSLQNLDQNLLDAARLTRQTEFKIFTKIVAPLTSPTLLLVFVMTFAGVVRSVDTISLLAPPNLNTLSLLAFAYAQDGDFEAASVVGIAATALSLVFASLAFYLSKKISGGPR